LFERDASVGPRHLRQIALADVAAGALIGRAQKDPRAVGDCSNLQAQPPERGFSLFRRDRWKVDRVAIQFANQDACLLPAAGGRTRKRVGDVQRLPLRPLTAHQPVAVPDLPEAIILANDEFGDRNG